MPALLTKTSSLPYRSHANLTRLDKSSRRFTSVRAKQLVGSPPLDYLLRWRMQLARDALRRDQRSVASLAVKLGYSSESAFGNAFKRGRAPKRYWTRRI